MASATSSPTCTTNGHNADSPHEASQYFSYYCRADTDHCQGADDSIEKFLDGWRKATRSEWNTWDWGQLKHEYSHCSRSSDACQRPLQHYGAFRDEFMQSLFCCARQLQTPEDPECTSRTCQAYDMTCPGSKLLTSDMDCTVYHSRDPGTLIQNMSRMTVSKLGAYTTADLGVLFDVSLYGTWTWIPDEIFRRFDWPDSSKALFERAGEDSSAVWVFRRKCTPTARKAILDKVKQLIREGFHEVKTENVDKLSEALKTFVGNLADGKYGSGAYLRDWDHLYQDFRAVSSVQREGYLTYAATLEVVGRQQVGLPTTFAEDYQCMRQVSFLEQLAFIVQHIQTDVPDNISESSFAEEITKMLLKSGKYFDRLLEVGGPGYDEGFSRGKAGHHDTSVLWLVLGTVYGSTHLDDVLHGVCSDFSSSMGTSAWDDAEVRRRSCMDIAMWGNAVRHMDAFRRDTGDLIRPMVQALFTCLVHPNATQGITTVKAAMLHAIQVWSEAVPELEPEASVSNQLGLWLAVGAPVAALVLAIIRSARKRAGAERRLL
eukprot:CAMPEP_0181457534 /NCGR_PEP_ID=MMETSP1110-20121109/31836_1 /TAXON_ID=174948 /ORGANISM="Symbiodinium sp., Strain CCMP421" /LENGTH=544 /DNA_ID=CAMNT_0023581979 /DNA_START=107 /DNA_END=1741 /DNA_ORIENTATION=+